jgi:hypothetical protein
MLERTDAKTNEVLEPIMYVVAYPTVRIYFLLCGSLKFTIYGHLAAGSYKHFL